jgi:hypothetical protein
MQEVDKTRGDNLLRLERSARVNAQLEGYVVHGGYLIFFERTKAAVFPAPFSTLLLVTTLPNYIAYCQ